MEIGKTCRSFCVLFGIVVSVAGCSSSEGHSPFTPGYDTYTTAGSDLVLKIPDSLEVSQEDIEDIHYYADQVSHCYTTNRETVDIVLAQACIYYDTAYLFPEFFPENLDDIFYVSSYVDYLGYNDPFTFYFSPESFSEVQSFLDGDSSFIGFTVGCAGQTVTLETPLVIESIDPYTRAWIDGFQVGDEIIAIDGIYTEGMDLDDVTLLIPTMEEETVEIMVDRDGVIITIYTAAEENIGLLFYNDIGYLNARSFTDTTGDEIRLDYDELQVEAGGNIDKLILDLRDNGGGTHTGMLMLIDYLIDLDSGAYPIMSTSGPAYEDKTEYLGDHNNYNINGNFDETNFVILIDNHSASASEVVSAVLKHYDTATLIGETTYGKGIGQSVEELIDGSGVFIPSINSLPPSGISYHGIGVEPDYYYSAYASSFDDDPVLDAAIDYLDTGVFPFSASSEIVKESSKSILDFTFDPLNQKLLKKNRSGNFF